MNKERRTGKDWRIITDRDGYTFLRERKYYEDEPDKCFDFYALLGSETSSFNRSLKEGMLSEIVRAKGITEEEVIQKLLNGEVITQP